MARDLPKIPSPDEPPVGPLGRFTKTWWDFLDRLALAVSDRLSTAGTATFVAGTSVAVTFAVAEPTANYNVAIEGVANRTYWVTSKATTGFTINASASNSDTVGWVLTRR